MRADASKMGEAWGRGGGCSEEGSREHAFPSADAQGHPHATADSTIHIDLPYFQKQIDLGF